MLVLLNDSPFLYFIPDIHSRKRHSFNGSTGRQDGGGTTLRSIFSQQFQHFRDLTMKNSNLIPLVSDLIPLGHLWKGGIGIF